MFSGLCNSQLMAFNIFYYIFNIFYKYLCKKPPNNSYM